MTPGESENMPHTLEDVSEPQEIMPDTNTMESTNEEEKMKRKEIIKNLFPSLEFSPEDVEKKYPPRDLKKSARVTRVAPSPTGFMHIGGIFAGLLSERLAHQSEGVFYVRIEDTDKKREVAGAAQLITESFEMFRIPVDEGESVTGEDIGDYGPYRQSERAEIYKTFVKKLLEEGRAYPCFCTPDDLEELSNEQQEKKARSGYYGEWAKWRNRSDEEVMHALGENKPFVIRFRSTGDYNRRVDFEDLVKGKLSLPENDQDIIIIKSDGLPTYHFAHVVDDHFMRTTHAMRGEEWLSSTPLHIELFNSLGWEPPRYGHFPTINKLEGGSRRKLSKRKDPEANVTFYDQEGYPANAIIEYLLNLIDSDFEDWRKEHPDDDNREFPIIMEHLKGSAGPILDLVKLQDIAKNLIGKLSADEVFNQSLAWAKKYDLELAKMLEENPDYARSIFSIERGGKNPRKDLVKWSDVRQSIEYFFDDSLDGYKIDRSESLPNIDSRDTESIINAFLSTYDVNDDKDKWFEKIKKTATSVGYAENTKSFKKEPGKYKGHVGDVAMILRVLLTGRRETPELFDIMRTLGLERIRTRLKTKSDE